MSTTTNTAVVAIHDLLVVDVPATGRVLVTSDLHLPAGVTPAATWVGRELAGALDSWIGPGVLILAGDALELLGTSSSEPRQILAIQSRLADAVRRFVDGEDRRVVYVVGNHDLRLAWDAGWAKQVTELLSAELALAVELRVETGSGLQRVRVEHGNRFDPANAVPEPRNPRETPLGQHVVDELLPAVEKARQPWLTGVEWLANPSDFPAFLASRLAYRRLLRRAWWLLVPFLVAALLRAPLVAEVLERRARRAVPLTRLLPAVGLVVIADVMLMAAVLAFAARRAWSAVAESGLGGVRGQAQNDAPRAEARTLIAQGFAGLVTGHTHHAELTPLGAGFYANPGCSTDIVDSRPARFGLPQVFLPERHLGWVELAAGPVLHVNLVHARADVAGGTILERLAARPLPSADPDPVIVASLPGGEPWPPAIDHLARHRRARRQAAAVIGLLGLMNLVSAFTPPLRDRLARITDVLPLEVPQAATAAVALAGLALLLLARGILRGQRRAWVFALGVLTTAGVLNVVKGGDVEEAAVSLVVAGLLVVRRQSFRSASDRPSARRGIVALVTGAAGAVLLGTTAVEVTTRPRLPVGRAVAAVAERLVGLDTIGLPSRHHRVELFLSPALGAVGFGLAAFAGWLLFRPVVSRHRGGAEGLDRARAIVARHGADTLAYFALRSDKAHFFDGDSVVAYATFGGVCLVSPDPVGPPTEREEVWRKFRLLADQQGWAVAVLGASQAWLSVYQRSGMHRLYIGDEAIVDAQRFSLEGNRAKSLRQTANRVARNGYRVDFLDPATLDPALRAALEALTTESRHGEVERGFSMTLGRLFDPADQGLLLAVAFAPDGQPAALCHYVPAGDEGYSLDIMRRSLGEHPNGLTDFVLVETIRHLRERGLRSLGLNFATMRAVLADEAGGGMGQRVQRWLVDRMSETMQIESLWRFTEKYDPDWFPRYAAFDAPENLAAAALAVARAEGATELPVIGRFLQPAPARTPTSTPD